jgi:hypothetical protein
MSNDDWRPPTEEEIRKRAYELYLERRRYCVGALDDWLEAEAELWMKRSSAGASSTPRRLPNRATRRKG